MPLLPMTDAGDRDVAQMRAAFFRRTRRMTVFLYSGLALAALGVAVLAFVHDVPRAAAGIGAGFVGAVALFALSPLVPVSAKAARLLVPASVLGGVLIATLVDLDALRSDSQTLLTGAFAGFLAGTIVGIAAIRRRLARDDDLILRQRRLGFDPERPWAWLGSEKD
jgi:hypothetical protein